MSERFIRYRFEELDVWKCGMEIVHEAYSVADRFPKTEMFGLSDQLKRAATSITLNVAEGTGQQTNKGFILYINRAKSSALECVACTKIALQEKFLTSNDADRLEKLLEQEYFKLIALAKSMNSVSGV